MKWTALPTEPGLYLIANDLIHPRKPYLTLVVEADGTSLAGLEAGLWCTRGGLRLTRVEKVPVEWFGPIPLG